MRTGPVRLGGLRSLARIFYPLLARKSTGFARILHDFLFARKWLFEKFVGGGGAAAPSPLALYTHICELMHIQSFSGKFAHCHDCGVIKDHYDF